MPMNLQYYDAPDIYRHTPVGMDFIWALHKTDNLELFALKSVQILIDNHWSYWRRLNTLLFGLPILANLLIFWYWSNIVLPNTQLEQDDSFDTQSKICIVALNFISFYFILMEIPIIYRNWKRELDIERLSNWIGAGLILWNSITQEYNEVRFWRIQTWAAMFVWLRFLLYLKSFSSFSWLIRMCVACVRDMVIFLIIFFIGVTAFADAFQSIDATLIIRGDLEAREIPEDADLYEKYFQGYVISWQSSFLTSLGEFSGSLEFYKEGDWLVWLLCAIFNIILLLNLLIAVISETYDNESGTAIENGYKEKVNWIALM